MSETLHARDQLTERIIGCIIRVHTSLGPGFLESIYQNAMVIECTSCEMRAEVEKEISIHYRGRFVGKHKLDLVIEDAVVVEMKTAEALSRAHYAQLRSYLRASGLKCGLLVNFATAKADIRRVELI